MTTERRNERENRPWADREDEIRAAESDEPAAERARSKRDMQRPRDVIRGRRGMIIVAAIAALVASLAGVIAALLLRPCAEDGASASG